MKRIYQLNRKLKTLANRIDVIIEEELKDIPNGIQVGSIGQSELTTSNWDIPKGKYIGFIVVINKDNINPEFLK